MQHRGSAASHKSILKNKAPASLSELRVAERPSALDLNGRAPRASEGASEAMQFDVADLRSPQSCSAGSRGVHWGDASRVSYEDDKPAADGLDALSLPKALRKHAKKDVSYMRYIDDEPSANAGSKRASTPSSDSATSLESL